jgi:hypothetical protein
MSSLTGVRETSKLGPVLVGMIGGSKSMIGQKILHFYYTQGFRALRIFRVIPLN